MRRIAALILFALLLPAFTSAQQLLSTEDLKLQVSLSYLELSPDGKRAVCVVSRRNYETNSFEEALVLLDIETHAQVALTEREGIFEPLWAPDGKRISFLATADGVSQIFVLSLQGGEAQQITKSKGGILHHTWSPDGKYFGIVAENEPEVKTGADQFNNAFEVGSNDFLMNAPASGNHAAIVQVNGENLQQISPQGAIVATEFYNSSLSWTPDGKQLALVVYPSSRSGDSDLGKIHLVDIETREMRPLTQNPGQEGPGFFSPDGKRMIYFYPRDGIPANLSEVYSASVSDGAANSLTRKLDREILDFAWLPDGRLLLTGYDGMKSALWLRSDAESFSSLDIGEVMEISEISTGNNGSIAFLGEEKYRPAELYFKAGADSKPVRITAFHDAIAGRKQGTREGLTWNSTNGFQADGVLTYPPDFNPDKKYPLVLLIHGGPTAASTLAFGMTAQMMAAKNWIVLEPNYRGSNHRGNAFQSAIANDAGEGPGQDVYSGVQELKKKPFIDGEKIAVSGWSYGGWMTAWMIGRYPDEWVAAVAGAAPVDYTDMYSLSDLNRMRRHAITDSPYKGENWKAALEQSPVKNFAKIKAPTLILSKSADSRVSITGSYKLYHALRDNGVKTQFIVYPGPGHLVSDPVRAKDVYDRWLHWLAQYLDK